MNHIFTILSLSLFFFFMHAQPHAQGAGHQDIPPCVLHELKRIEETYRVLDHTAGTIWPGWNDYRSIPFLLVYQNGLQVLVGHPSPPEGFAREEGLTVGTCSVYIKRSSVNQEIITEPLSAGAYVAPFGTSPQGPVRTVRVTLRSGKEDPSELSRRGTDERILMYIHELFHCFQPVFTDGKSSGLEYNPDTNYAVYSELEADALNLAYHERDLERAKEFAKDFLCARELKRRSMTPEQAAQESGAELKEGTAVYAETRALEILRGGYKAGLTDDPWYRGFQSSGLLLDTYNQQLHRRKALTFESLAKSYYYGCFQALILDRLFPGWQESLCTKKRLLDQELADRLPMSGDDTARARTRLATSYGYDEVEERHRLLISRRDSAYREMKNRQGMTYILDFKPIRDPVSSHIAREREFFSLGLMRLYPAGVGSFTTGRISVSTTRPAPVEMNQIFYLKLVDTRPQRAREPYRLTCEKQEGAIFHHATITTPLFQVVAPKVQVVERKNRVKIIFLSRE